MQYNKRLPCENWEYAQQDEWIKQNTMKHCPHIKWMGPCGQGWNFQWNDASWKLFDDPKEDVVVTTQAEDEQEELLYKIHGWEKSHISKLLFPRTCFKRSNLIKRVRNSLAVQWLDFHSRGPGSIPGRPTSDCSRCAMSDSWSLKKI